jgi:large subunit ribosomal protein L21
VFAIIKSGGRQVRVTPGTFVDVDRVAVAAGEKVTIDEVLFVGKDDGSMLSGAPFVAGAKVIGVIAGETRGPKIRVFKKRRRKTMRVSRGHRSTLTRVEIKGIEI